MLQDGAGMNQVYLLIGPVPLIAHITLVQIAWYRICSISSGSVDTVRAMFDSEHHLKDVIRTNPTALDSGCVLKHLASKTDPLLHPSAELPTACCRLHLGSIKGVLMLAGEAHGILQLDLDSCDSVTGVHKQC